MKFRPSAQGTGMELERKRSWQEEYWIENWQRRAMPNKKPINGLWLRYFEALQFEAVLIDLLSGNDTFF